MNHQDARQEHQQGFLQVNHRMNLQDARQEHQQGFLQVNHLGNQLNPAANRHIYHLVSHLHNHLYRLHLLYRHFHLPFL